MAEKVYSATEIESQIHKNQVTCISRATKTLSSFCPNDSHLINQDVETGIAKIDTVHNQFVLNKVS